MKRKTLFLIVVAVLMTFMPARAQVHVGVLAGVNHSRMSFKPTDGAKLSSRTGFAIGGIVELGLGADGTVRFEPMYIMKGGVRTIDGVDNEIKLTYVELPFFLRFDLAKGSVKPYLMAGPVFGFNLAAKVKAAAEKDMKDDMKSLDFGFGFGAGISFPMGKQFIMVEARYALGSTNVNDSPESTKPEVKNHGVQVFVGYTFALKN